MLVYQTGSTMTNAIEVNGYRLDRTSQIVLQVLRDRGGTATTGLLAERADERDDDKDVTPSHIRYRFNHHLNPLGFVEQAGQIERGGGTWDAYTYRITDRGREYLDQHQERILNAVDAATATERLRETRLTVDRFDERLNSTEQDVAQLMDAMTTMEERVNEVESNVDKFHNVLQRRRGQLEERLDDRITGVEDDLSTLRENVLNMSEHVKTHREWIRRLQATVEGVPERLQSVSERVEATEDDLTELRQAMQDSPLRRLF